MDLSQGLEMGRVAVDEHPRVDADDAMDQEFVQIESRMRTDTEGTLVGHNDDESGEKEVEN